MLYRVSSVTALRIHGTLDQPATITIWVLAGTDRVVRTLMLPPGLPGAVEGMIWDGRDETGRLVIGGLYIIEIGVTNAYGTAADPVVVEVEVFY